MMSKTDAGYIAHPIPRAVDISGLSRSLLYRLAKDGKLRITKIGSRSVITDRELRRLIATYSGEAA
jgi:hypothetical protein